MLAASRPRIVVASFLASGTCVFFGAGAAAAQSAPVQLPTPLDHYESYSLQSHALALMPGMMAQLDRSTQQRLLGLVNGGGEGAAPPSPEDIALIVAQLDLEQSRHDLIELLIHGSSVLDMVPADYEDWRPIVHDSFLVVMNGMRIERIRDRVADQATLTTDAGRGDRLLAFGAETPTFQKIGQIIGRYSWVPEDLRAALQTLESDISTSNAPELVAIAEASLGREVIDDYRFEFESQVLSEASIGAVIGATLIPPGEEDRQRVVVKIIKDYAVTAIDEDLRSIDHLLELLQEHREFYGIGATPLVDMFEELKNSLAREVLAADERENLRVAAAYFADNPRVVVPELCVCSSDNVTVMERIDGVKVTDAFVDSPTDRTELAGRLTDVLLYDVMFAPGDSLFHGDPHAGNVFSMPADDDPYRIALLDWGLQGRLSAERKQKLVQVGLGLQLHHADRLRDNMDMLLAAPIDLTTDGKVIDGVIERVFAPPADAAEGAKQPGTAALLDRLVAELAKAGYTVNSDLLLYVKSLVTINGVIADLDPEFKTGDHISGRVTGQVMREMPKRIGNTLWIPGMWSHDYPTMASNNDVWATALNSAGLGFKAVGVGFWKGVTFPFRGQSAEPVEPADIVDKNAQTSHR